MSNDLIPEGEFDFDPWVAFEQELIPAGAIIGQLLKFDKNGKHWMAGRDDEEVILPIGTRLIAYVAGVHLGWVHWVDGRPAEHDLGLVAQGDHLRMKERSELGDLDETLWPERGDPWQKTAYLFLTDPKTQQLYTYCPNSIGGKKCIGLLSKEWRLRKKFNDR
jgi:hypothetical protein